MLPSPFRYEEQAILYVPQRHARPASTPAFVDRAADEIVRLLELSRGRAFVLFTSYANMNAVAERIAGRVEFPLLMQGEAPKRAAARHVPRHAATPCCSRPRPSGRASTSPASSSRA